MTAGSGEAALIWCPFPDAARARAAVAGLLDNRLIACGNLIPAIDSLFAWQGERGEAAECAVVLKTTGERLTAAMAQLRALHPYAAPAIAGWTVHVDPATLAWLQEETARP